MRHILYYGFVITIFCSVLFVSSVVAVRAISKDNHDDPETTEVIVKLNTTAGTTIDTINAAYGTTTIEVLVDSAGIYRLRVATGAQADVVAKQMAKDARLFYAEPNYSSEAPEGNPAHIGAWGGPVGTGSTGQYAVGMLDLADAHALRRGKGVTVAILDTGVQFDHPDLVDSWTTARYDFIDDDNDPTDVADGNDNDGDGLFDEAFGHGTHIAGIIHLVAPDAKLMPLRVLNADGNGNIFVIAEAIQFAVDHGADVINLSLGSPQESDLMDDILKEIIAQQDVVVVAAAGNLGNDSKQFPASEDGILAVTAINEQSKKSDFANFGDWVDVSAPGEAISSAFPVSDHATWSGTSMAVPFVAGHAALVQSAVPSMSALEIAAYVRVSAQSIDAQNPGFVGKLGAGRIDVGGSIQAICNANGTCSAPDLTGQIILESLAVVTDRPENGLVGTWVIGGNTFVANGETEFQQDRGALAVGVCAEVEYRNTVPFTALRIRSREMNECAQAPTATPTKRPTKTPVVTATGTSTVAATKTATTTATMTPSDTPVSSKTATPTPASGTPRLTKTPVVTNTSTSTPDATVPPGDSTPPPKTPLPNSTMSRRQFLPLVISGR